MRFFALHICLIIALLSSAISPACAFISGKGGDWIEICSNLDIIKINRGKTDTAPDMTEKQCDVCQVMMSAIVLATAIIAFIKTPTLYHDFQSEAALVQFHASYQSRAPPVFS
jgi:hypothetical protein